MQQRVLDLEHFPALAHQRLFVPLPICIVLQSRSRVANQSVETTMEAGKHQGGASVAFDVSERRPEIPLLLASDEWLHVAVDAVQDYAILMLDPEGHVATWNAGAERIKGYRAEEIIGQHFSRFYTDEAIRRGWPDIELARTVSRGTI